MCVCVCCTLHRATCATRTNCPIYISALVYAAQHSTQTHTYTRCTCTERNLIENCHNTWSQRNDRQINAEKINTRQHTELLSLMQLVINLFLCVPTIWYERIKLQRSVFDSFIEFIARLFSLYPFMFTCWANSIEWNRNGTNEKYEHLSVSAEHRSFTKTIFGVSHLSFIIDTWHANDDEP